MSAAHTPGPWIWAAEYRGLYGAGPDNAVLDYYPCEGMHLLTGNVDANARLIAAAPDLLAALQVMTDVYAEMRKVLSTKYAEDGWSAETMTIDNARAAIAKATGAA